MAATEVHALFIHGVGEQPKSFAAEARHNLRASLLDKGVALYSASVHWAPLADRVERRFLSEVQKRGSKGNLTQSLVVGTLSDALMYVRNFGLRTHIFDLIDKQIMRLRGEHVTVFAHSLGGLIFTDYLRSRTELRNVSLVTFGCNIGLFTLGERFVPVPQLAEQGTWWNLYSARDMLGFPLAGDPNLRHVKDIEVSVGGWFKGWTGLAHVRYWDDRRLWRKTIPNLLAV